MLLKICDYKNDNEVLKNFEKFKNLLITYNKKFNLTSITEEKEIEIKHFEDSIQSAKCFFEGCKVIEIGSGGGFPSVPLKIVNNSIDFTLVESTRKKCEFLNVVKNELCFKNFNIINERCEVLAKNEDFREKFDFAVARAVANLSTLCEYMLPFVKIGGYMIAYKGEFSEELCQSENALKLLGGKIEKIEQYELSENFGNHSLIFIKKIEKTSPKYPRGNGKERSKPL